jgi:hypothetical protein
MSDEDVLDAAAIRGWRLQRQFSDAGAVYEWHHERCATCLARFITKLEAIRYMQGYMAGWLAHDRSTTPPKMPSSDANRPPPGS